MMHRLANVWVVVGTALSICPHTDPYARLSRIRFLLWVFGVEAFVGTWMQDSGNRNPTVGQRAEPLPVQPGAISSILCAQQKGLTSTRCKRSHVAVERDARSGCDARTWRLGGCGTQHPAKLSIAVSENDHLVNPAPGLTWATAAHA